MTDAKQARRDAAALINAWSLVPDVHPGHEVNKYLARHGAAGVATAIVVWLDLAVLAVGGHMKPGQRASLGGAFAPDGELFDAERLGREQADAKWAHDLVIAHLNNDGVELRRLVAELVYHDTPNPAMTRLLITCGTYVLHESVTVRLG